VLRIHEHAHALCTAAIELRGTLTCPIVATRTERARDVTQAAVIGITREIGAHARALCRAGRAVAYRVEATLAGAAEVTASTAIAGVTAEIDTLPIAQLLPSRTSARSADARLGR
jgi:hypothetical protein